MEAVDTMEAMVQSLILSNVLLRTESSARR